MGFPGSVDNEKGVVVYTPNLRWNELPIAELVLKATGVRPRLIQDTGAAVWGEYLYGAGKGLKHVACATIGSGVAVGIVANGRLYGGAAHTAGEIGHMHVEDDGLLCGCGKRGCLEAYASGLGLVKIYHSDIVKTPPRLLSDTAAEQIDSRAIFRAARQNDQRSLDCIDHMARMLARGLNATAAVLAPEVLILSGGLSVERKLLFEPVRRYFEQYAYHSVRKHVCLKLAQLRENAPLIGAASLYLAPEYEQIPT